MARSSNAATIDGGSRRRGRTPRVRQAKSHGVDRTKTMWANAEEYCRTCDPRMQDYLYWVLGEKLDAFGVKRPRAAVAVTESGTYVAGGLSKGDLIGRVEMATNEDGDQLSNLYAILRTRMRAIGHRPSSP